MRFAQLLRRTRGIEHGADPPNAQRYGAALLRFPALLVGQRATACRREVHGEFAGCGRTGIVAHVGQQALHGRRTGELGELGQVSRPRPESRPVQQVSRIVHAHWRRQRRQGAAYKHDGNDPQTGTHDMDSGVDGVHRRSGL
ncbi:MAG: hypothetical protein IPK39_08285 [Sulfuritalea sp.]|nr:hypothetical protein [Sulfuritalea sp.]